jgi:Mg-chelatase subunit ChlD
VILFSNGVQRLSPVMITANTGTKLLVSNFVARLREGGSTNMKAAIETGLDTEAKEVMVLTDGLPTDSTPEDILDMVESRNEGDQRRVSTVGVGADQAKDFLKKLAEDNGGEYVSYD